MTGFSIKQIGLAICLMGSVAIGSTAACMCSHHQEKSEKVEASCHGSHETPFEQVEVEIPSNSGDSLDRSCICFVNQPNPVVVSKSDNKKAKSDKDRAAIDLAIPTLESVAGSTDQSSLLPFESPSFYSVALKSLLPSRAPPRL